MKKILFTIIIILFSIIGIAQNNFKFPLTVENKTISGATIDHWNTSYGWGNHAGLYESKISSKSIGFLKWNGTVWTWDASTYVTGTPWTAIGYLIASDNIATATKLLNPKNINGQPFDGSANITILSNVSPGTNGNIMTSNGTAWTSAVPPISMVYPTAGIPLSTGTAWGTTITDNSINWNTAYTDRNKWDGGVTGLVAATGRTSLGATTIGSNLFTLINPSAITFPQFNADNTITPLSAAAFKTAIGANSGTVTSVAITTPTGLAASGTPITTSGTLGISLQSGYSIPTTTNQTDWTNTKTTVDNAIQLKGVVVPIADSNYQKPGSYTPQYQFKTKSTIPNFQKTLKKLGGSIRLIPIALQISGAIIASPSMSDAQLTVALCEVIDTITIQSVTYNMATAGTSIFDAYNGIGMYSLSGTTATKIIETANSATIWAVTAGTNTTVTFPSPVLLVPGFYYITLLGNWSTANIVPTITMASIGNLFQKLPLTNSVKIMGVINSQATLPSTFETTGLSTATYCPGLIIF